MINNDDQVAGQGHAPATHSRSRLSSYNFLLRLSKRMGVIATRSFVEVKEFFHQDITMKAPNGHLVGLPRLHLQRRTEADTPPQTKEGAENSIPERGVVGVQPESESAKEPQGAEEGLREKERAVEEGELPIDSASKKLEKIINQSHEILAEANTVFPVTLFPDTVVVDRTKVTIIKRDFFMSSDTMSFRIEDVLNAEVTVGPLFGSLTIASRVMSTTDHFRIDHFWRKDAVYLKRIIQGYVIAQHNKIDVAHLSKDELIKTLDELGHHRTE